MKPIVFELYANLERLAGAHEIHLELTDEATTVADGVNQLASARPELASSLERCACVSGDTIIRRADALPADGRIALLPPVAGG